MYFYITKQETKMFNSEEEFLIIRLITGISFHLFHEKIIKKDDIKLKNSEINLLKNWFHDGNRDRTLATAYI